MDKCVKPGGSFTYMVPYHTTIIGDLFRRFQGPKRLYKGLGFKLGLKGV